MKVKLDSYLLQDISEDQSSQLTLTLRLHSATVVRALISLKDIFTSFFLETYIVINRV